MTVDAPAGSEDVARAGTAEIPARRERPAEDAAAMSLVLAARDGSRSAWDELVRRFTPLLWAIACGHRLSRDDAAQVVEMTWLRCVERLHELRDQGSVAAWLVTICHRESLIALHQASYGGWQGVRDPADVGADRQESGVRVMADAVIEPEESALLHEAISTLPDRPRQILFTLLHGDG